LGRLHHRRPSGAVRRYAGPSQRLCYVRFLSGGEEMADLPTPRADCPVTPQERLKRCTAKLLDSSLGLDISPGSPISLFLFGPQFRNNPYLGGFRMGALYALFFCGLPWFLSPVLHLPQPSWPLFFLQIYASFWCGWSTMTTRLACLSISETIENNIILEFSDKTAENICRELTHRFEEGRLLRVSWGIAVAGAALSGFLIVQDVGDWSTFFIVEVVWWCCGWAILFATAAKVVNVARFYGVFADHLEDTLEKLYVLDPARSTLVISVASVARRMLLYWFGIALSIALIIPFSVKPWEKWTASIEQDTVFNLFQSLFRNLLTISMPNSFVLLYVLITGIFSIGFGTIVFLRSEATVRGVVGKVTRTTLRLIEDTVAGLFSQLNALDEPGWKRLTEFKSLHADVAAAGTYRSVIISGVSVLVAFVPLISLLVSMLTGTGKH
jgi:hypothetical protein